MKNRQVRLLNVTWKDTRHDILKTDNNIKQNYLLLSLKVTISTKKEKKAWGDFTETMLIYKIGILYQCIDVFYLQENSLSGGGPL